MAPDATYTDKTAAYGGILREREVGNHGVGEYVRRQAHTNTNTIDSSWSMLKQGHAATCYNVSPKHLNRYIRAFAGRHSFHKADATRQMAPVVAELIPRANHMNLFWDESGSAPRGHGPGAPGRLRDDVGLVEQPLPRHPAGVLQGGDVPENPVDEAVGFQEQNDLLHPVELQTKGRELHQRQIAGNDEVARAMRTRAVEDDHAVRTRRHGRANRRQMRVHRRRVRPLRYVGDSDAAAPCTWRRTAGRSHSDGRARCPDGCFPVRLDPRYHPIFADTRFVLKPDIDRPCQRLRAEPRRQQCREARHEGLLPPRVSFRVDRPPREKAAKPRALSHYRSRERQETRIRSPAPKCAV